MVNKENKKELLKKIKKKQSIIGLVGLGYVGLPLAILFSKKKFKIVGVDYNKSKINSINSGISYFERIKSKDVKSLKKGNTFTTDFKKLDVCDVIVICVPTPLNKNNKPDLSHVKNSISNLKKIIKKGTLIILESTSYPGTTRDLLVKNLEKKFRLGEEVFIGFSSERINPGKNENSLNRIPKVVSGFSKDCEILVDFFYKNFFDKTVLANSLEVAEFSKLLENIYRSVNIGFINEMKFVSDKMGIDIFEVLDISSTKPYGFMRYNPSPGIGGHCIPIDPYYLYWRAKKFGISPKFIKLSGEINIKASKFVINKILTEFTKSSKNRKNFLIIVLGLAYKKNIDDLRESASLVIIEKLLKLGFLNIKIVEPYSNDNKIKIKNKSLQNLKNYKSAIKKSDLVLLLTDHDKFEYSYIKKYAKRIIDTRGRYKISEKIIRG